MKTNHIEVKWQQLVAALADGVIVIHQDGAILYANEHAAGLFGRSSLELIGQNFMYPLASNDAQEIDIIKPNGQVITAEMNVKKGAWAEESAWIISMRDITEKKHKIEQLELASNVFKYAHEGIMVLDIDSNLIEVNQSFITMTGYTRTELIGQNVRIFKSGHHNVHFYERMYEDIKDKGYWSGEIWEKHKNGTLFPVYLAITAVTNQDNQIISYIGFAHDLGLLKKQEDLIINMKLYDPLTKLANQYHLSDTLSSLMRNAQESNLNLIIAYIAIDGVNSEKNSSILTDKGKDALILSVAHRISSILKKDVFLARISCSDFVAIFKTVNNVMTLIPVIQELSVDLTIPFEVSSNKVSLTSSIGITSYPQDLILYPDELIRQSHLAAYEAKYAGDNQYKFFDRPMELEKIRHSQQIQEIKNAIATNQLMVFYQPKINMHTGVILGAEALLRFQHPQKGLLAPSRFLPDIANHPISIEIGEWVLHQVLSQLEQWQQANISIPISINISPYHLQQDNFLSRLKEILAKYPKVSANLIELEILETEVLDNIAHVKTIIDECKKMGLLFALDDFGTGYSLLTYLKELPTSWVKLDQTFVRDIISKPEDISLLKASIEMCKLLNRKIIAEGVETLQHGKLLAYLGCTNVQGYAISKPVSAESFRQWLNDWTPFSEWNLSATQLREGKALIKAIIESHSKISTIKQLLITGDTLFSHVLLKNSFLARWVEQKSHSLCTVADMDQIESIRLAQKKIDFEMAKVAGYHRSGSHELALSHMEQLESLNSELLHQLLLFI